MKIAILGGSFNPVHLGHLFLADAVLASGYDRIIFVPAFQSPFKAGTKGPSPSDRLDMLCASIAGNPRLTVDDCEIRRAGVSYTVDTIADIKQRYLPEGKPGLILGDDLADTFYKWKGAASIAKETDIIIAKRLSKTQNAAFPFPHREIENEIMDISSRLVREKIQNGENWRSLLPDGARFIIEDRQLYGYKAEQVKASEKPAAFSLETIVFFENLARRTLSPSRFLHSRNTALLAWDLCLQYSSDYNLDPYAAYLAGITHDLCKSMDDDEIMLLAKTDGLEISKLEMGKPSLLHGRAAAVLLQNRYDIKDKAVIEAVQNHVTGNGAIGPLAKVIYIADKIEVSRYWVDTELRALKENSDLDDLFKAVLGYTIDNIDSQQTEVAQQNEIARQGITGQLGVARQDIAQDTRELLSAMEGKSGFGN